MCRGTMSRKTSTTTLTTTTTTTTTVRPTIKTNRQALRLEPEQADKLPKETNVQQQNQQQQLAKNDEKELNLSFCGCGFLGIYHVGVASCFHEYAPQISKHKISGSSAGALVAVAHICGNLQLAYATTDILRVAIDARARALGPFHPSFDINAIVRDALEKGLPDDVHIKANGRLHVSLTRVYDGQNVIISEFTCKEDVIQVLLCSCFIPFWSGLVAPKYKGVTYVDGGFSNNSLILDDKTVTVSPFAGEADICPRDDTLNLLQINLSNTSFSLTPNNLYRLSHALLPPPPEVLSDLCEQGFADGIRYLQQMNLISCTKCLEIRSSLLVTTSTSTSKTKSRSSSSLNREQHVEEAAFTTTSRRAYSIKSSSSYSENIHIRLQQSSTQQQQQQHEQKMIEINGIRNSVVTTTSQIYSRHQQQQQQKSKSSSSHHINNNNSAPTISNINSNDDDNNNNNDNNNNSNNSDDDNQNAEADSLLADEIDNDVEMDDLDLEYDYRKQQLLLGFDLESLVDVEVDDDEDDDDDVNDVDVDRRSHHNIVVLENYQECVECVLIRQRALYDPLPKQFSDRIRGACDAVNKSLTNWLYSHRPIKYLSYLAAPYYLPIDISFALIYRCWKTLPFSRSELFDCVYQIVEFLIGIQRKLNSEHSSTTALLMRPF